MTKRRKLDKKHYLIIDENKNHESVHSDDGALDDYDFFDIDGPDLFFRNIKNDVLLKYCLRTEAKKVCFIDKSNATCVCDNPCLEVHQSHRYNHFKLNKNSKIWKQIVHRDTEFVKKTL